MSTLVELIDDLPSESDKAIEALFELEWNDNEKIEGYFEKEVEGIRPNSLDEFSSLYFLGKVPKEVYNGFLDALSTRKRKMK